MADTPSTVNQSASIADRILRAAIGAVLPFAQAAEIAAAPFLGYWFIAPFWNALQNWIIAQLTYSLSMYATFTIITFQTVQERDEFNDTISALRAAIAKGDLSDPELLKKSELLDNALDRLVHYDGSFSPKP